MTGWWFGTCFIFSHIWNNNLSEGVGNPPTSISINQRLCINSPAINPDDGKCHSFGTTFAVNMSSFHDHCPLVI